MADGYQAGSAYVPVVPDFRKFHQLVGDELDGTEAQFAKSGQESGSRFGEAFSAELKKSLANLPEATVKAAADTSVLTADLDAATKARTAPVTADANVTAATADLDAAAKARTAEIDAKAGTSSVDADFDHMARARTATFMPKADTGTVGAELDALARTRKTTIEVDGDTAKSDLDAILAKIDAIVKPNPKKVTIQASLASGGKGIGEAFAGLLKPAALTGALAAGPSAAGLGAGVAGIGAGFLAAAGDAGAFGVIAKSMFTEITAAQKALTTAQKQYANATTDAGRTKALAAEKAATANLTGSEMQLFSQVTKLKVAWTDLSHAEQPAVGAAITPWLKTATDGMGLLKPLITDGANAVQVLGSRADQAIKSPFWTKFATVFGQTGEIALTEFGDAAGKVADGVAHIFVAFAPDIDKLPKIVDDLATGFDHWGSSVSSKGLDTFLSKTFTPANVKALAADGKDLGTLVENIAKASGSMSPLAFGGVSNLLDVAARLNPAEIEAVTGLFLAIKTISSVSKGVSAASDFLTAAKGAASKVGGWLGLGSDAETTAEAETAGTEAGAAGGKAAKAAFTESLGDPWAGTVGADMTVTWGTEQGTSAGEAAGKSFAESFSATTKELLPGAFTSIEAESVIEGKIVGTASGEAAGESYALGSSKKIVQGSVVKEGESAAEGSAVSAAEGSAAAKAEGSAIGASLIKGGLFAALALAIVQGFVEPTLKSHKVAITNPVAGQNPTGNQWDNPGGANPISLNPRDQGLSTWAGLGTIIKDNLGFGQSGQPKSPALPGSTALPSTGLTNAQLPKPDPNAGELAWTKWWQDFDTDVIHPMAAWFDTSLPGLFTSAIPRLVWSPVYTGFERDVGSPIAAWFTNSLPHALSVGVSGAVSVGKSIGSGVVTGWDSTQGALTTAFGAAKNWTATAFSASATWLTGAGKTIEGGLSTAWNATAGSATTDFGKAKTWATSATSSASTWLKSAGTGLLSGLTGGYLGGSGTATADIGKVKGWATSAVSGASSWLVAAGEAVMSGFLAGLEAKYATVQSFVGGIASWVAAHKGPLSYDYKLLQPAGASIMGGFGDSLQAGFAGSVKPVVSGIAPQLAAMANAQSLAALGVPALSAGARLPGVSSPVRGGSMQLQVSYAGTGNDLTDSVVGALQFHVLGATGGDVQGALGRGPVR